MARPLLMVGDIHLGRSPHRLEQAGLDARRLGPDEAWRRLVRHARDQAVQAVVLAGDVVDRDQDRFEAYGLLERGVSELVQAGVRVLGVAGNHDHLALPRLDARLSAFTLLGPGATWQRAALEGLDLLGWSFPARHHAHSPLHSSGLEEALDEARPGLPVVGVLHADLDAGGGPYAPVARAELLRLPVSAWFLGHAHRPDPLSEHPVGNLGSLVGLDRGEIGPRGPWLVEVEPGQGIRATHQPLGPVAWLDLEVDLSREELRAQPQDTLHAALERAVHRAAAQHPELRSRHFGAVGCSARLVGRVQGRQAIGAFLDQVEPRALRFDLAHQPWVVVSVADHTLPALDLDAMARERGPVGQLARLLTGAEPLPQAALTAVRGFEPAPWSAPVDSHPLPETEHTLRRAALVLLEQILEQRS